MIGMSRCSARQSSVVVPSAILGISTQAASATTIITITTPPSRLQGNKSLWPYYVQLFSLLYFNTNSDLKSYRLTYRFIRNGFVRDSMQITMILGMSLNGILL